MQFQKKCDFEVLVAISLHKSAHCLKSTDFWRNTSTATGKARALIGRACFTFLMAWAIKLGTVQVNIRDGRVAEFPSCLWKSGQTTDLLTLSHNYGVKSGIAFRIELLREILSDFQLFETDDLRSLIYLRQPFRLPESINTDCAIPPLLDQKKS